MANEAVIGDRAWIDKRDARELVVVHPTPTTDMVLSTGMKPLHVYFKNLIRYAAQE